jgi:hypothetical protein
MKKKKIALNAKGSINAMDYEFMSKLDPTFGQCMIYMKVH